MKTAVGHYTVDAAKYHKDPPTVITIWWHTWYSKMGHLWLHRFSV